jgi:hypothetical protein
MSTVNVNRVVDASGGVLAPISSVMRNRIINGAMVIDQRNAGASVSTSGSFPVDRFVIGNAVTSFTAQRSTVAPAGFINSLLYTSTTGGSAGANDRLIIRHRIEGFNWADLGWGTASAKTVTLSFKVRSSLTGTFSGSLRNSNEDRSYPFSFTISSANTFEDKSITIVGDTTGTWETGNGTAVQLSFDMGSGSSKRTTAGAWAAGDFVGVTGAVSVSATTGATFYITGVQLEVGTQATSFEYRQFGTELSLCQRYYWKNLSVDAFGLVALGTADSPSNNQALAYAKYPVTMRSQPTISFSSLRIADGTASPAITSINQTRNTNDTAGIYFGATAGGLTLGRAVAIQGNNSTTGFIDASAEL